MGDGVNTNVEALHEIKNSLVRFQERITPLQGELMQAFQEIDEQLADGINRKMRQIEERQRKGTAEGRTDSFACDTCKGRIHLKIMGDTTHCREAGCNGTLHRVYTDRSYSSAQRNNDKEELEQLRRVVNNYNQQKADFLQLFSSFFSSEAGDVNRGVASLASCISILEQYLGTDISIDAESENSKKKIVSRHLNHDEVNSRWQSNVQDIDTQIENYKAALMERGVPDCKWLDKTLATHRAAMLEQAGYDLDVASGKAEISTNRKDAYIYPTDYPKFYDELASDFSNYCLTGTNPNYKQAPEWQNNCQRCVPTYESRRRGNEVSVHPSTYGSVHLAYHPFDVWEDAQVIYCEGNGMSDIQHTMSAWGNGSRAQVVVYWDLPHGGGHTFIAEQVNGQTIFTDPQTGDSNVSRYFERVVSGRTRFCRIDNLDFSGYSEECYTEV